MPFRPLRDQILVKPIAWRQSRTLDVVSNDRYSRAIVIAVGPGEQLRRPTRTINGQRVLGAFTGRIREMEVKPGNYIVYGFDQIFPRYIEEGIEYRILQDKDVCFISEPDFIDAHSELTDAQIDNLIQLHRRANRVTELHA